MKIALLQMNPRMTDPEANSRFVEAAYMKAVKLGIELVVTTE